MAAAATAEEHSARRLAWHPTLGFIRGRDERSLQVTRVGEGEGKTMHEGARRWAGRLGVTACSIARERAD